jgi:hypothetical protein
VKIKLRVLFPVPDGGNFAAVIRLILELYCGLLQYLKNQWGGLPTSKERGGEYSKWEREALLVTVAVAVRTPP